MAKQHGRLSSLLWNSIAVGGIVDIDPSFTRPKLDATTHDTGDGREFIDGRIEGSINATLKWDEADAGQTAMEVDFFAGDVERASEFRMQTGSGLHKYTGNLKIESWEPSGPNDEVAEVSVGMYFNGSITHGTQ